MDNLMLFYPLIVLLFFIFFDVRNRKKRPAPPPQQPDDWQTQQPDDWQTQLPEERQGRGYEGEDEEAVPWYVEFPEDRAPKKQPEAENTCQEPAPQQKLLFRNPCINVLSRRSPSLPLKAFAAAGQ